ncbi:hypothetical protein EJB05_39859 [Eragrostis curvula]|uniref:Uncharacterized protein n=1 Tax=Eragrostis curvula TaxID=38414 RepID=A0A5J9TY34_9POAL|nr:hypothetical protein EJB05_39859 [Eragrostis curvula]
MAALRPCPCGPVVGAPRLSITSTSRIRIIGRHSTSLLKTAWAGSRTTAANLQHRYPIRAHNGAADYWSIVPDPDDDKSMTPEAFNKFREELKKHCELDKGMPFREDIEKIDKYWKEMTSWKTSIFHMEATALSLHLCMMAKMGVNMASGIMECAGLRVNKQDEISLDTTKQTIATYVSIFVKLVEDTYHNRFHVESMFSLLGAFRGVAAISHILLQDALASVKDAEDITLNYNFVHDKDNGWHEFEQQLNNLEDKFREVSKSTKLYKLMRPTMEGAMTLTLFFVSKMDGRLKMALGKIPGDGPRHFKASDDGETGT